jgi:hypothetical protein
MREINQEVKTYVKKYVAIDGTEFNDREECIKYENSAKVILKSKFLKLVVKETDALNLLYGNEDTIVYYVQFREEKDIDTLIHYMCMVDSWLINVSQSEIDRLYEQARKAFNNAEPLLVSEDCDGTLYILDPLSVIVSNLSNYDAD